MDAIIRDFENSIMLVVNASDLPVEVKRLVAKDIYHQLDEQAFSVINSQRKEATQNGD